VGKTHADSWARRLPLSSSPEFRMVQGHLLSVLAPVEKGGKGQRRKRRLHRSPQRPSFFAAGFDPLKGQARRHCWWLRKETARLHRLLTSSLSPPSSSLLLLSSASCRVITQALIYGILFRASHTHSLSRN
jgi:hypothetical protein